MIPSTVKGHQLVLTHARDASGVEESAILAHVQGKGIKHVGSIPGESTRCQPKSGANMVIQACKKGSTVKFLLKDIFEMQPIPLTGHHCSAPLVIPHIDMCTCSHVH